MNTCTAQNGLQRDNNEEKILSAKEEDQLIMNIVVSLGQLTSHHHLLDIHNFDGIQFDGLLDLSSSLLISLAFMGRSIVLLVHIIVQSVNNTSSFCESCSKYLALLSKFINLEITFDRDPTAAALQDQISLKSIITLKAYVDPLTYISGLCLLCTHINEFRYTCQCRCKTISRFHGCLVEVQNY